MPCLLFLINVRITSRKKSSHPPLNVAGHMPYVKKADTHIDYFDDEELDAFRNIPADGYNDAQIDAFRDVLYTLRKEEIEDWLISLEKREINLPEILRPEALEML